jgi:hypothetical protein
MRSADAKTLTPEAAACIRRLLFNAWNSEIAA